MEGPTLERLDQSRRFYNNMDWSKDEMGSEILQADDSVEARNEEAQ